MNSTIKLILPLFVIITILGSTISPLIKAETKIIDDKKPDQARKHIIYISGEGLEEINYNNNCFQGPLGFFYNFYGFNGSYVGLFYNNTENIFMIKDGIPRNIQGPVYLEFGLSDPNTFAFLIWPNEAKSFILAYCLYIIIDQNSLI
jgi:hypothetical protein